MCMFLQVDGIHANVYSKTEQGILKGGVASTRYTVCIAPWGGSGQATAMSACKYCSCGIGSNSVS